METTETIPTVDELLAASAATPAFAKALQALHAGQPQTAIHFGSGNPPVKVVRVLCAFLEAHPEIALQDATVNGVSGCSDYSGELAINGGSRRFRFLWDCAIKAEQLGWKDYFGSPDQIRAARTFGYRCIQELEEITR